MLMSSAMRPKSWPKTSMKAFTKFCLASFWTLGSKQSPEKLCQLIPFRNNTGPSTSERDGRERTKGTEIRDKKAIGGLWMNKWMGERINEGKRWEKEAKVDKWEDQLLVMVYIYIYIYIWMWGWSVPWQKVLNAVVAELSIHKLKNQRGRLKFCLTNA